MMDIDTTPIASIAELIKKYEDEVYFGDDRAAAEYAYVVAIRLRDVHQIDEARDYARRALHHAERLPSATLEDVASARPIIGGVPIPELFHDGVIRSRLSELLRV